MSRKVRIKRRGPEDEHKKLQTYLDKKITEAMNPVLQAIHEMQITVDTLRDVVVWMDKDLDALIADTPTWNRLPAKVQQSLNGLKNRTFRVTTASGLLNQADTYMMKEDFHKAMLTPTWLDEAMKEADDMDLSDLLSDD